MKQIDLDPKEYRAQPIKGEPLFVPGALRRVAFDIGSIVVVIAVGLALILALQLAGLWLADVLKILFR